MMASLNQKIPYPVTVLPSSTVNSNQTYNCTKIMEERNATLAMFQLVLLALILLFGTLFNSFAVWVFCFKMKKWTETRVFMMSLLFSDCCLLITIPFRIYATQHRWDLPRDLCTTLAYAYFLNTYLSIAIITLISVDRYIAIKFPLRSRSLRSPKKAALACAIVFALLLTTRIFIFITSDSNFSSPGFCFRKTSPRPLKRSLYFTITGFYIPLPVIIFCTLEVVRFLKTKDKASVYEHECIQKSIKIVSGNLIIFLVCFLPVHIGNITRFVIESLRLDCALIKQINDYVYAAQVIGDLNCCLDSVCYYFVAKEFWESTSQLPKLNQLTPSPVETEDTNL
ncbi:G-protein coupled receptor 35 [Xenopus laevis]|uniref:G-protein coupled receptor 35 n=2 Tax=Xenopus laevis TaxID=8355 RepID=A0A1L8GAX1_XENLA|nr:G-protein coupled receptor 35 [Xenopus laevis]XP_041419396.1 G-protein coupled receptor 35 [Xenopus laevis]XP_041419397.1 G-protein coupled receptor 35 [Xenopus laevis]OCT81068.1 hypothetical protein XELAEV_18027881mg [Xenopus laevis]